MQIGTNIYFNLQNYSNNFKAQDLENDFSKLTEAQEAQSSDTTEESQNTDITAPEAPNGEKLDASEQQYVRELAAIDASVRAHEAAHVGAGAGVVSGGASFGYTRGPDGKMYATSGEVPITMKEGRTPEETIQNARQIASAAMAPADPSPQDYKVAANAAQMEAQARSEQAQERAQELKEQTEESEESQETDSTKDSVAIENRAKQDSKQDFVTTNDAANMSSANAESQNTTNEEQQKKLFEYIVKSYVANAVSNSYTPQFEIAG